MKYPYYDYVWIASDSEGCVAAFVTAGEGPIPSPLLALEGNPISKIEKWLLELPVLAEPTMLREYSNTTSFVELGRRGVFVFDWSDVHKSTMQELRAYELVCKPEAHLKIVDLPDALKTVVAAVGPFGVAFASSQTLHPGAFVECVEPAN